ncbi:Uncharacterised protein [Neisseria gonorrhoeae]|nr:Uncharacterised protein [Neisseria gonorrhoeae]
MHRQKTGMPPADTLLHIRQPESITAAILVNFVFMVEKSFSKRKNRIKRLVYSYYHHDNSNFKHVFL